MALHCTALRVSQFIRLNRWLLSLQIDAADSKERLEVSRYELGQLMTALPTVPIVVLGNKIDSKSALSEEQLKQFLGVTLDCTGKGDGSKESASAAATAKGKRPFEVFMCAIRRKAGHAEAVRWLADKLPAS